MAPRKTGRRKIVDQPGFVVEAHASLSDAEARRILREVERDFKSMAREMGVSAWIGSWETDYDTLGKETHVKLTMTKDQTVHIRMAAPKKRPAWKDELFPRGRSGSRKPKQLPAPKAPKKKRAR